MIDLAHTDEILSKMPPLTWRRWSNDDMDGPPGPGIVVMTDSCTTPENDSPHHAFLNMQPNPWNIADDGAVTPSVHFLDCGWHDHVRLLGWVPEGVPEVKEPG